MIVNRWNYEPNILTDNWCPCIRTSVICRQLFYLKFFFKHFFPDGGNLKSKFGINATVHYFLIDANEQWTRRMNWTKNKNEKTKTISICNWRQLNPHLAIVWRIYLLYGIMFYIPIDIDFDHDSSFEVDFSKNNT